MRTNNQKLDTWLRHRIGHESAAKTLAPKTFRGFELNKTGLQFAETFGKRTIHAFVGFIDLANFSSSVTNWPPEQIADYLKPFLHNVLDIVASHDGMADKTIGDEVMFAIPERDEIGMPSAMVSMRNMLTALREFAYDENHTYCYRISLSYGDVLLDQIATSNYGEWTLFGETVHAAKRMIGHESVEAPKPIAGIFGMRVKQDPGETQQAVRHVLQEITDSKWLIPQPANVDHFKGTGDLAFASFSSKGNGK